MTIAEIEEKIIRCPFTDVFGKVSISYTFYPEKNAVLKEEWSVEISCCSGGSLYAFGKTKKEALESVYKSLKKVCKNERYDLDKQEYIK